MGRHANTEIDWHIVHFAKLAGELSEEQRQREFFWEEQRQGPQSDVCLSLSSPVEQAAVFKLEPR